MMSFEVRLDILYVKDHQQQHDARQERFINTSVKYRQPSDGKRGDSAYFV
jgi:hypothetical protein